MLPEEEGAEGLAVGTLEISIQLISDSQRNIEDPYASFAKHRGVQNRNLNMHGLVDIKLPVVSELKAEGLVGIHYA